MKLAILALFLLVSIAAATSGSQETCQREMSQHSLSKCRSFMKTGQCQESLLMPFEDDNEGAPPMCCKQLKQVKEECRCPMIMKMMKEMADDDEEGFPMEQQECRGKCGEMMMRAKFLPAMCDMSPHTCSIRRFFGGSGTYF